MGGMDGHYGRSEMEAQIEAGARRGLNAGAPERRGVDGGSPKDSNAPPPLPSALQEFSKSLGSLVDPRPVMSDDERHHRILENEKLEEIANREGQRLLDLGLEKEAFAAYRIAAAIRTRREKLLWPF